MSETIDNNVNLPPDPALGASPAEVLDHMDKTAKAGKKAKIKKDKDDDAEPDDYIKAGSFGVSSVPTPPEEPREKNDFRPAKNVQPKEEAPTSDLPAGVLWITEKKNHGRIYGLAAEDGTHKGDKIRLHVLRDKSVFIGVGGGWFGAPGKFSEQRAISAVDIARRGDSHHKPLETFYLTDKTRGQKHLPILWYHAMDANLKSIRDSLRTGEKPQIVPVYETGPKHIIKFDEETGEPRNGKGESIKGTRYETFIDKVLAAESPEVEAAFRKALKWPARDRGPEMNATAEAHADARPGMVWADMVPHDRLLAGKDSTPEKSGFNFVPVSAQPSPVFGALGPEVLEGVIVKNTFSRFALPPVPYIDATFTVKESHLSPVRDAKALGTGDAKALPAADAKQAPAPESAALRKITSTAAQLGPEPAAAALASSKFSSAAKALPAIDNTQGAVPQKIVDPDATPTADPFGGLKPEARSLVSEGSQPKTEISSDQTNTRKIELKGPPRPLLSLDTPMSKIPPPIPADARKPSPRAPKA